MKRLIALITIIWLFWPYLLFGQGLSYRCQESLILGLGEPVTQLGQAHTGHLLLGQSNHLHAFDGQNIKPFDLSWLDINEGPSCFFTAENEVTWIGFNNGVIAQLTHLGDVRPWRIEEGWPQAKITAIQTDKNGQLWIATYGEGVYCYRNSRLYQFGRDDGLESEDIYSLVVDDLDQIWAISDAGLSLLTWDSGEKIIKHFSSSDGLPDDILTAIIPSSAGGWIGGYEGGIARFNYQDEIISIQSVPRHELGTVTSIIQVDDDEIWVGTLENGIHIFSTRDWQWLPKQRVPASPTRIHQLYLDDEGLVWIASKEQGICRVQPRLQYWEDIPYTIQALDGDADGNLWIGTDQGLFTADKSYQTIRSISGADTFNIISLHVDVYGLIWIGTFGEGIYIYNPTTGEIQKLEQTPQLQKGNVFSISGNQEYIWLATLHGVFRTTVAPFSELSNKPFSRPEGNDKLGTDFLYCSHLDNNGNIWFGTDGFGLSNIDQKGKVQSYRHTADSLPIRSVFGITSGKEGRIWISTDQQQIYRLDSLGFTDPNLNLRFQVQEIVNLASDDYGNILIAHKDGVAFFDAETDQVMDYHHLASRADLAPSLNAIFYDSATNSIWVAGKSQLLRYSVFYKKYRQQPAVSLSSISIYLEPFNYTKKHTLSAKENNLIFHFDGVWLTDAEEVRFRYRLRGFDQDWIHSRDHQAVYSNLPPGDYVFQLEATQNNQFDGPNQEVKYNFSIQKPYYQQVWFILFALFTIGLLVQRFIRTRETRLKKEARLHKEKVVSQYEMLKSQINPHFLFNSFNTLVSLIEEETDGAVTYVEKLADFYRSILQYRGEDTVTLEEEMAIVNDYVFLLKQRYQDNLKLKITLTNQSGSVPPFAAQMLVENAVKHNIISASSPLVIRITIKNKHLIVKNAINKKLTNQPSTGFGLDNIQHRYALLSNQSITIENDGKYYSVALPLL